MSDVDDLDWGQLIDSTKDAFKPLPAQTYEMVVDSAEAATSSTQKLMFKLRLKIVSGPETGRTVLNNITLTPDNPRAVFMFFKNMEQLGLPESVFKQQPKPTPDMIAGQMVGRRLLVEIDHREYMGTMRDNVKSFKMATGGSGPVPGGVRPTAMPTATPSPQPHAASPQPSPAPAPAPAATAAPAPTPNVSKEESTIPIPAPENPVIPEPEPTPEPAPQAPAPAPAPMPAAPRPPF